MEKDKKINILTVEKLSKLVEEIKNIGGANPIKDIFIQFKMTPFAFRKFDEELYMFKNKSMNGFKHQDIINLSIDNVNFEITSIEGEESIKYEIDRNGNIVTYVE